MTVERDALLQLLVRSVVEGKLEERWAVQGLRALAAPQPAGATPVTMAALLTALEGQSSAGLAPLAEHLWQRRLAYVRTYRNLTNAGQPVPSDVALELDDLPLAEIPAADATPRALPLSVLLERPHDESLTDACRTARFPAPLAAVVEAARPRVEGASDEVRTAFERVADAVTAREREQRQAVADALAAGVPIAPELDDALAIQGWLQAWESADRAARPPLLDQLLVGRLARVAAGIVAMADPSAERRAELLLTLRVTKPDNWLWRDWLTWARTQEAAARSARADWFAQAVARPLETLVLVCLADGRVDPSVLATLAAFCGKRSAPAVAPAAIVPPAPVVAAPRVSESAPVTPPPMPRVAPAAPIAPPRREPVRAASPAWVDYFRSFLTENWYLVAGLAMVVVGASLLAYFTWDKTWLLRYTIMPGLLAAFTFSLGALGTFLERPQAGSNYGSAALMRATAILLLPINFITIALLAEDPTVTARAIAVPIAILVYLTLFGWGLHRWCRSVHPALTARLAPTLLFLCALITLSPIVTAWRVGDPGAVSVVVGAMFYLGFAAVVLAVGHFVDDVLDATLAQERRVPWFFGSTLLLTYIGAFIWVHAWIRHLPHPYTYAPLVILGGGLVFHVERRFLALRAEGTRAVGESFLGFAFVLLGLLMGMGDPDVRILAFALAGIVWFYQAAARVDRMQYVVALTLLCLSGASVGLLDGFPHAGLPAIGAVLAAGLGLLVWASARSGNAPLADAGSAVQYAVLVLTAIVAVLTQWHDRSAPLPTALWLIAVAVAFVARGLREQKPRTLFTAMTVLALSLPYLGCVDMQARVLHGNTLTFGLAMLSMLWLLATLSSDTPLVRETRSTVLWLYGALASGAMLLRVVFEPTRPLDAEWGRVLMNEIGPIVMAVALVVASYLSRSLLPSAAAVLILVVLFPELKLQAQVLFPWLHWGSGLGSGLSALGLMLGAFRVRRAPGLQGLSGGDVFIGGAPFPFRRTDPSLFTIPLLVSVVFLGLKVDTYTLLQKITTLPEVPGRTAAALLIVGVTWTLLAAYRRSRLYTHLGWMSALAGIGFGLRSVAPDLGWQWTFVVFGVLLEALILLYPSLGEEWVQAVLVVPTRQVVVAWGVLLTALVTVLIWGGYALHHTNALAVLLCIQWAGRAFVWRRRAYGGLLFALAWTVFLAATAPGVGVLPARLSVAGSLTPNLWLFLGVAIVYLLLEAVPDIYALVRPLVWAARLGATVMAAALGLFVLADLVLGDEVTTGQAGLALALILLVARMHACGAFAALAVILGNVWVQQPWLLAVSGPEVRLRILVHPWRVALGALAVALIAWVGEWVHRRAPRVLAGAFGYALFRVSAVPFLLAGATGAALLVGLRVTLSRGFWNAPLALLACYVAVIAIGLVARRWGTPLWALAGVLLTLPDVLAVRLYCGPWLYAHGLSNAHLVALGLALTLSLLLLVRALGRGPDLVATCSVLSEGLAAAILLLLCANYLADPNIAAILPWRFVISGVMALVAGLYFRRAAEDSTAGHGLPSAVCEGLYHFGITLSFWCFALLIPWLRRPQTALLALALPGFYFHLRAESVDGPLLMRRYRNSASTIGLLILALYVFRGALQMLAFPEMPIRTDHYHENAALVMAIGLMLLRLHALGGGFWLAFYGGLSLVIGSYFGVTAWPGLSPFTHPMPSAWIGIALAHFWAAACYQRSPLRTAIQAMAALDDETWRSLRHGWGLCVLAGVHVLVLIALFDARADSYIMAPVVAGAASVWLHYGILRGSAVYAQIAAAELLLALHGDFVVPSYLPRRQVVFVLVGIWAVMLLVERWIARRREAVRVTLAAAMLAVLIAMHVGYHGPSSDIGLAAVALLVALALATPTRSVAPQTAADWLASVLPFAVPAWLAFFSQMPRTDDGYPATLTIRGLLLTLGAILATGSAALAYAERGVPPAEDGVPRLAHRVRTVAAQHGALIRSVALAGTFLLALALHAVHYDRPFRHADAALFAALYVAFGFSWHHEGRRRRSMIAHAAVQIAILALFALVRRQLFAGGFWTLEYDIWLSLALSFALTGAKGWIDERPEDERLPLVFTLLALPAATLLWTVGHHLGTDTALLVVGVQSVLFAFLGKDDRESPYHVVAISGFVGFVCLVFWSKLGLHSLQAYVIPVGLGVLTLLQMFERRIDAGTRNGVRAITMLAMLGSSGYQALIDDRYPLVFNGVLLALCLCAMAAGSLLRVRVYLVLGFCGVMVDLASIVVKVLVHMDRGPRMTVVGGLVLLAGIGLVGGAVYYKARREELEAWLDSWRPRLARWE